MAINDLVRRIVGDLKDRPEEAKKRLLDFEPAISAKYLVGVPGYPLVRAAAQELLVGYGASDFTVKPLVASLVNPTHREAAVYVLERYDASTITVNPLVGALSNKYQREAAIDVLTFYGPSKITVRPLIASLGNDPCTRTVAISILTAYGPSRVTVRPLLGALIELPRKDAATEILKKYGRAALRYIKEPIPGNKFFTPVREITDLIRAGNT